MNNYDNFLNGILEKRKVYITYFSQKENKNITRLCAPFDFGPKRKQKTTNCFDYIDNGLDKYHFWDYDGSGGGHISSKNPQEVIKIELLDDIFIPQNLINLNEINCPWHINRNW